MLLQRRRASSEKMSLEQIIELVGRVLDGAAVAVIAGGVLYAAFRAVLYREAVGTYTTLRQNLGRCILLGLELLLAADIIRTVAIKPTLESVLVLGGIVLIRTFLSMALEVELGGTWPWKRDPQNAAHETRGLGDTNK